jgi:(R,R)-butanediol dehydrogenase/meso-butanediol dehydrogenase/diacetyl reductase
MAEDETRVVTIGGSRELREYRETLTHPAPGRVIVDVTYAGICGTDVHGYVDGYRLPPAVFGHEWTGTLSAVGEDVRGLKVGQRVVGGVGPSCGACPQCIAGHARHCDMVFAEANGLDDAAPEHGAFAGRVQVAARRVIPVPDELTDIEAALVEPAAVTFHAVHRVAAELGAIVVVQGAGPIGLLTAQHARLAGAGDIIISEPSTARRQIATMLGFANVVTPEALRSVLYDRSQGRGADVVYECAGVASLLQPTAQLARRGGILALLGYPLQKSRVSYADWQSRELTIIGSLAYNHEDFLGVMNLIAAERLDVDVLHTGTVGLGGLRDTLEDLDSGTSRHMKVLVSPRG